MFNIKAKVIPTIPQNPGDIHSGNQKGWQVIKQIYVVNKDFILLFPFLQHSSEALLWPCKQKEVMILPLKIPAHICIIWKTVCSLVLLYEVNLAEKLSIYWVNASQWYHSPFALNWSYWNAKLIFLSGSSELFLSKAIYYVNLSYHFDELHFSLGFPNDKMDRVFWNWCLVNHIPLHIKE